MRRYPLLGAIVCFLVAACLDDPRDSIDDGAEIDAVTGASHRDGCSISSARTCGKIQCCRSKTCCITLDGQRVCSTTKVDCVPVPPETVAP